MSTPAWSCERAAQGCYAAACCGLGVHCALPGENQRSALPEPWLQVCSTQQKVRMAQFAKHMVFSERRLYIDSFSAISCPHTPASLPHLLGPPKSLTPLQSRHGAWLSTNRSRAEVAGASCARSAAVAQRLCASPAALNCCAAPDALVCLDSMYDACK